MIVPDGAKIFVVCSYTDMLKQINKLSQLVEHNFQLIPFDNAFFLFCGRWRD
ncbi:MAG: IS66 family insertion sequence element accessory protein TnpB [Saccharofermentanales bacterium]